MKITIGLISKAEIIDHKLIVMGYLMIGDHPTIIEELESLPPGSLGISYEMEHVKVRDCREDIWELVTANFTGAAILLRSKAAYRNTSVRLIR